MFKSIISSSLMLLLSTVIGRLAMFILSIMLGRTLSQDQFGQFMFLRSISSTIDAIVASSFGNVTLKSVSEVKKNREKVYVVLVKSFLISFIIFIIMSLLLFLFFDEFTSKSLGGIYNVEVSIAITVVSTLVINLSMFLQKIHIGLCNYWSLILSSLFSFSFGMLAVFACVNSYGFIGALVGVCVYFLIDVICKLYFIRKQVEVTYEIRSSFSINSAIQSQPLLFSSIVTSISFFMFRYVVLDKSNDFASLASFDVAYQMTVIIMLITGSTTSVALQYFSSNLNNIKNIFFVNISINLFIAISISILFCIFSENIMSIYGEVYISKHYLIYYLSAMSIFATFSSVTNKLFIASERYKIILRHGLFSSIISLGFIFLYPTKDYSLLLSLAFLCYYVSISILDTSYILINERLLLR